MIEVKINVNDIPKEQIYVGEKGKYLTINVAKMQQQDAYGNDYTCYIYDKATKSKIYIGKGKGRFEDAAPVSNQGANPQSMVASNTSNDVPF